MPRAAVPGGPALAREYVVMKSAALAVVPILLCGCSLMEPSKPDAVDLGGGRYSVSGTTLSGNISSARQVAAVQAHAFCGSSSRQAVIETFADKVHGDAWGASTSRAIFYCK
jgi:hypothetical protein